jgi:hypothetical protein
MTVHEDYHLVTGSAAVQLDAGSILAGRWDLSPRTLDEECT